MDNDAEQDLQTAPERKSRAQLKRDRQEIRELGVELVALSAEQLREMPLSERTVEAVVAAQGMTRIALKRQIGHIPALLLEEDIPAVRAALAGELQPHADEVEALHEAEEWRDRLLASDKNLTEFIDLHPGSDPHPDPAARPERQEGEEAREAAEVNATAVPLRPGADVRRCRSGVVAIDEGGSAALLERYVIQSRPPRFAY